KILEKVEAVEDKLTKAREGAKLADFNSWIKGIDEARGGQRTRITPKIRRVETRKAKRAWKKGEITKTQFDERVHELVPGHWARIGKTVSTSRHVKHALENRDI